MRPLSDEEKAITLHTVDDLITNNLMTNRGPGNGVYNPSDFGSAYVTVPMMTRYLWWETPVKGLLELCPSNTIPSESGATMVMKRLPRLCFKQV